MNLRASWPAGIPRPRDYLETGDGLRFAVVSSTVDDGHALTSLRYLERDGALAKLSTGEANEYLRRHHPDWLSHSPLIDAMIHRVPLAAIVRVHRPDDHLAALRLAGTTDSIASRALHAVDMLAAAGAPLEQLGLGGSLVLGAQHTDSDIDLVVYGRHAFQVARHALAAAIASGRLGALDPAQWESAWRRRGSDLTLAEYVSAELRKLNKAVVDGTRVDLTLVVHHAEEVLERGPFRKLGRIMVQAEVVDATSAFDHPARYGVRHDQVHEVVSFTPTYAGQAVEGEVIEVSGWLEQDSTGARRVVVGTSREAGGEHIKSVRRN